MTEDSRQSSRPVSDVTDVASGSGSAVSGLTMRGEETLSLEEVVVEYSPAGTVNATIELYDESDGTSAADASDRVDKFHISPGDSLNPDMVYRDVEDGVLLVPDGTQDGEVTVTVGGHIVTG